MFSNQPQKMDIHKFPNKEQNNCPKEAQRATRDTDKQFDKIKKIQKSEVQQKENMKNHQTNVLELKNTMIELKSAIESFNRRLNQVEDSISELENR